MVISVDRPSSESKYSTKVIAFANIGQGNELQTQIAQKIEEPTTPLNKTTMRATKLMICTSRTGSLYSWLRNIKERTKMGKIVTP